MTVSAKTSRARLPDSVNGKDPSGPKRRDLLTIEHLPIEVITHLLDRSDHYYDLLLKPGPFRKQKLLEGRTIANLFFENSTRTRTSFELAERRLGADSVMLSPSASSLTKGESMLDTMRVFEAMKLDAIVVRHSAPGFPQFLADYLPAHVHCINAGDGAHEHPTQALLDAAALRAELGPLRGRHIAIVGDILHSRVARSNVWLLKKLGARVTFVAPETLMPREAAEVFGIETTYNLDDILPSADAIMLLRIQLERQARGFFPSIKEYSAQFGLTPARMANSNAYILHPGPINHGIELESEMAYGEHSLVLAQVKRGVAMRMAVLEWIFEED